MKRIVPFIFLVIILYFWIFEPALWMFKDRLAISNVIMLAGGFTCIAKPGICKRFVSAFYREYTILGGILLLSLLLIVLDFQVRVFTKHLIMMVNVFCVMPVLFYYAHKRGIGDEKTLVKALLTISATAAAISIMCIVFPSFHNYIRFDVMGISMTNYDEEMDYRGFGFASQLVGNYGFTLGFLAALGCFYLKENRWYLFALPFIALAIMVNARTGIIIALVGIVFLLFQRRSFIATGVVAVLALFVITNFETLMSWVGVDDATVSWILTFQTEMSDVVSEQDISQSNTVETLFKRMIVLPEDPIQWIVGRGFYLYRNEHGVTPADVGWINQLNYGGLIYFIPLLMFFIRIFRTTSRNKGLGFGLFVLSAIVIANTKGQLFPGYSLFLVMMMVYFVTSPKYELLYKPRSRNAEMQRNLLVN